MKHEVIKFPLDKFALPRFAQRLRTVQNVSNFRRSR